MTLDITKTTIYKIWKILSANKKRPLSAPQIADIAGIPTPSVRRLLAGMKETGWVKVVVETPLFKYVRK